MSILKKLTGKGGQPPAPPKSELEIDLVGLMEAKYAEGYAQAISDLQAELKNVNSFALLSISTAMHKVKFNHLKLVKK